MSTVDTRGVVFGFLAGIWILLLGIYIYLTGLYQESGMNIVSGVGGNYSIVYVTNEITPPFSSYGLIWAVPFFLLGMYLMFLAVNKR